MIVQCSACQTRFKIADDKVTERGVKVRCTKCANTFVVRKDPAPEPPREEATRVAQLPVPPAAREDPFVGLGAPEPDAHRLAPPVPGADPFAGADSGPGLLGISPSPGGDPFSKNSLFGTLDNSGEEESAYSEPTRVGVSLAAIEASRKSAPAKPQPSLAPSPVRMPPPAAPAPARPPPAASGDPFADLNLDLGGPPPPASAPVNQAKLDLGGGDPFRIDAPAPAAPRAPPPAAAPAGGLSFGDDLNLNLGGPTPEMASTMPAFKLGELDNLGAKPAPSAAPAAAGFSLGGELDLEAPPQKPAAPPARQPTQPPKQAAPAPKPAAPAMPDFGGAFDLGSSAPPPSGGESPEFDSESASGLELDVAPPKNAPRAAPPREKSNPSTPRPQPTMPPPQARAAPAPRAEVKAPEPPAPAPAAAAPVNHPAIPVPRAPAAPRPAPVQKKSTLAALLNAFLFAMIGLAVLGSVVWLQTGGEIEWKDLNAQSVAAMFAGKAQGDLVAKNATNGLYETRGGHPVFFVRGQVVNQAATTSGPVQVDVELRNGSEVVRRSSAWAGQVPTPEDLYKLADAVALNQLEAGFAKKAQALEAGKAEPFVVVFWDYPDDLADMRLRITPHVAARVAAAPRAEPEKQAAAEARPPEPAPPSDGAKADGSKPAAAAAP